MGISRGDDWSQSLLISSVRFNFLKILSVSLVILSGASGLFAKSACNDLLDEVDQGSMRPLLRLLPTGNPRLMPSLPGAVSHGTNSKVTGFMYFVMPGVGNDYAVVRKSSLGFGFSPSPTAEYELVESSNLELVDLQPSGKNSFFLSALAGAKSPNSIVLKMTRVEDGETGKLSFMKVPGLALDLAGQGKDVRLAPRPGRLDFWLADKSDSLRVISFGREQGLHESFVFKAEEFLGKDPSGSKFVSVEAVNFLSNGIVALVTAKTESGNRWIIPVVISEKEIPVPPVFAPLAPKDILGKAGTAEPVSASEGAEAKPTEVAEPQIQISYTSYPKNAFPLQANEKVIIREDEDMVILVSPKRVRGVSLSLKNLGWTELVSEEFSFLNEGEILVDFNF